jgi:hypothetical protein
MSIYLDCTADITLHDLSGPVSCHIADSCTAVECCVDADVIGKSFHVSLTLDGCLYTLSVGIEKRFVHAMIFADFTWGERHSVDLEGVVVIE